MLTLAVGAGCLKSKKDYLSIVQLYIGSHQNTYTNFISKRSETLRKDGTSAFR